MDVSIYVDYLDLPALNNHIDNKLNHDADEELDNISMGIPMDPDLPVLTLTDNDFDNGHNDGDTTDNNSDSNGSTDQDEEANQ